MDEDRDLYLGSRENTLYKSWVTDLWMKVIKKAIDDLVLYTYVTQEGKQLSEEETINANTAYGFLFDPEYTIQIGNMEITTEELIAHWDIEDVNGWRKNMKIKIQELIEIKRKQKE